MIARLSLLVLVILCSVGHCLIPVNIRLQRYATSSKRMSMSTPAAAAAPMTGKLGHLMDVGEALHAPLDVILKAKRLKVFRGGLKDLPARAKIFFPKFIAILHPMDILGFTISLFLYKPLLKLCHAICAKTSFEKEPTPYEKSLFGRCEGSVLWLMALIPFVYVIDLFSIAMHTLGFDFHIKGDIPRLLVTIYEAFVAGCFIVNIKDWGLMKNRIKAQAERQSQAGKLAHPDMMRQKVVDELSTIAIWTAMGGFCLEAMSLEMGFALGSIFAVGGLGSASVVLALKDTMENIIGGLMLKFEDKLRVGEYITVPAAGKIKSEEGVVEDVSYVATTLRREDNSVVVVPNQVFSKGEIINWSRTPFRLFKTTVAVKMSDYGELDSLIAKVKSEIAVVLGVETIERDLIVSATGFKADAVTLEIETHLRCSTDREEGAIKTAVIGAITRALVGMTVK